MNSLNNITTSFGPVQGAVNLFPWACYTAAFIFFLVAFLNATECVKARRNTMIWQKEEMQNCMIALLCGSALVIAPTLIKMAM